MSDVKAWFNLTRLYNGGTHAYLFCTISQEHLMSSKLYLSGHLTYALRQNFSPYNNIKCRTSHGIIEQNGMGKANSIAFYVPNPVKCYNIVFVE